MPRTQKPFVVYKRKDRKAAFCLTLNPTSGLPARVCRDWKRRSFQNFPPELLPYSRPKNKDDAEASALALIIYLKNDKPRPTRKCNITVGDWVKKFTSATESPKAARLISKNRPYSDGSVDRLKGLYDVHMKGDPFMDMLMAETESQDALAFLNRMGLRKLEGGMYCSWKEKPQMVGTESYIKLIKFVRMAFKEYGRDRPYWQNPFRDIEPPKDIEYTGRDSLTEDEVISLFKPGVLREPMEVAICSAMFWAGLRRGEIFALRPEDLDWGTPKILVRKAWQNYSLKKRRMDKTKSKRSRVAPFDEILQDAIRALWEANGEHEFVFSYSDGSTPGPSWIRGRLKKWLSRAGIELGGRNIVPHSSRNSLAQVLEDHDVSLRHIQELLGHLSLKTTKKHYLLCTEKKIREIGSKINKAMEGPPGRAAKYTEHTKSRVKSV